MSSTAAADLGKTRGDRTKIQQQRIFNCCSILSELRAPISVGGLEPPKTTPSPLNPPLFHGELAVPPPPFPAQPVFNLSTYASKDCT